MTIKITFGEILNAGCWDKFCETYGYNEWMLNEGLALPDETVEIDMEFARQNGILRQKENEDESEGKKW